MPQSRSAQSLGRNARPLMVMPWMTMRCGAGGWTGGESERIERRNCCIENATRGGGNKSAHPRRLVRLKGKELAIDEGEIISTQPMPSSNIWSEYCRSSRKNPALHSARGNSLIDFSHDYPPSAMLHCNVVWPIFVPIDMMRRPPTTISGRRCHLWR